MLKIEMRPIKEQMFLAHIWTLPFRNFSGSGFNVRIETR